MAKKAQVVSDPSLQRDLGSNAIISANPAAYQARIAHKAHSARKAAEVGLLRKDVESLTAKVNELASLVKQLTKS